MEFVYENVDGNKYAKRLIRTKREAPCFVRIIHVPSGVIRVSMMDGISTGHGDEKGGRVAVPDRKIGGRFALLARLGGGATGEVWLAEDGAAGLRTAVKISGPDAGSRSSLEAEAGILKALSHPAVPKVLAEGTGWFAMEYAMGSKLSKAMASPLPAVQACSQIARALEHVHGRGFVHGDVNPEHILVSEEGRAMLVDFSHASGPGLDSRPGRGTPGFMAPENLMGLELGPAGDVYSLGASLYCALSGAPPYPATGAGEEAARMNREAPKPVHLVNPAVDEKLAAAIMKAIHPDPKDRYRDAAEFAGALERWADLRGGAFVPGRMSGRSEDLDRALRIHACAKPGTGIVLAVTGSKGVGKTRFIEELHSSIRALGLASMLVRCRGLSDAEAEKRISWALGTLAASSRRASAPGLPPALLVCGLENAEPLRMALKGAGSSPCPFAAASLPPGTVLPSMPKDFRVERIELLPLKHREIEEAVNGKAWAGAFSPKVLESIVAVSAGLPGVAMGIVEAAMRATGKQGGILSPVLPFEAGEAGAGAFAGRVIRMDSQARSAAEAVAVLGEEASEETVARTSGLGTRRAKIAVEKLCSASVLVRQAGMLRFAVQGAEESILASAEPGMLKAMNLAAAKALRKTSGPVQRIALHMLRAGEISEGLGMLSAHPQSRAQAEVEDALRRAADSLKGSLEGAQADAALGRMLVAAGKHGEAEERIRSALRWGGLSGKERENLAIAAADTGLAIGDFAGAMEALSGIPRFPAGPARALLAAAEAKRGLGRFEEAREELGFALVSGGLAPEETAGCHHVLGKIALDLAEISRAEANFAKALNHAEGSGDFRLETSCLVNLGLCSIAAADFAEAGSRLLRAGEINMRRKAGLEAEIDLATGIVSAMTGDSPGGFAALARALSASRRGLRPARGTALSAIGKAYSASGGLRKAGRYLAAAREALRAAGAVAEELSASTRLALVLLREKRFREADDLKADFEGRTEPLFRAVFLLVDSEVHLSRGDAARALDSARAGIGCLPTHVAAPQVRSRLAAAEASCLLRSGGAGDAERAFATAVSLLEPFPVHLLEVATDFAASAAACANLAPETRRFALSALDDARRKLSSAPDAALNLRASNAAAALEAALSPPAARSPAPAIGSSASQGTPPGGGGRAVADREKRLLILQAVARRMNQEQDFARIPEMVLDMALSAVGAQRGFILASGGGFEILAARNMEGGRVLSPEGEISFSIAKQVVETGLPVMTEDATCDGRFMDNVSVRNLNLKSVMCVPLLGPAGVLGALYAEDRQRAGAFTEDDLWFLSMFAEHAAVALSNARLRNEIERRGKELDRLNRELCEKVARQEESIADLKSKVPADGSTGPSRYPGMVGISAAMQKVFSLMDRIAASEAPVLIVGRSGTGKELVAKAIHACGPRKAAVFAAENCAALTETLLESELFGHEKGSFTGAFETKKGLFELADGGTLFLDEVSDMSHGLQSKLLRVLQEGEIRRVGGKASIRVDARIISATNRELEDMVKAGSFREDLYYRLNVLKIEVPPLKDRKEDIPLLARHFLNRVAKPGEKLELSGGALDLLAAYDWPGNVRELENEILRAAALGGKVIGADDLSPRLKEAHSDQPPEAGLDMGERVKALEIEMIRDALARAGGNKSKAAQILGISRFGLQKKMDRYGMS